MIPARSSREATMSRLPRLRRSEVEERCRAIYDNVAKARGNVPNMYRIYAHRPEILATMTAHLDAITNTGTVPVRTKELVATLVSRVNHCEY
jgi:alkylhydroperoxidase family enzyme